MYSFKTWVNISGIICILCTWLPVETAEFDFISLISSPDGDFCITNSSSAMYYTTTDNEVGTYESSYHPPITFCNLGDTADGTCLGDFLVGDWKLSYSLLHANTPLLDVRWEHLPIKELAYQTKSKNNPELAFTPLAELYGLTKFKVPLSLRGEEAHLLLCDKKKVEDANCYWFALQGWNQKFTVLRRCKIGEIKGEYPRDGCKNRKKEKKHPKDFPLYMEKESWSHVIIERDNKDLYLKTYNEAKEETIIHYSEDNEMFDLKYLLGHRKQIETYCKVHENFFVRSTTVAETTFLKWFDKVDNKGFCISLLLNTCPHCLISISFMNETDGVILEKRIQPTNGTWKNHKLMVDVSYRGSMRIKMKTELEEGYNPTYPFWSFDNIRTCHEEEYRITQKDPKKFAECRLLANNQKVKKANDIDYVPDTNYCSLTFSIGSPCISCNIFRERTSCKKLKICENLKGSNKCYCSPGYTGNQCDKECREGTYGYHCEKNCGFCQEEGKCKVSDGSCKCNDLFKGLTCHTPKRGQYLRNAPKIIGNQTNACEIQWDITDYIGDYEPKYYLIQYQDTTQTNPPWIDYEEVQEVENVEKAMIENLDSSKKYRIRILTSVNEKGIKNLHSQNLPFTICNTTCNGWNKDDIDIKTTADEVTVMLNLPKDRCDVKSYKYELKLTKSEEILSGTALIKWNLKGLIPFSNYTISLFSDTQKIIKEFSTKEGVPSQVREIQKEESTSSYMKIRWEKPKYANGVIKKYKIFYQKIRRISCSINPGKLEEIDTPNNSIELNNLQPYSVYRVEVFAFNSLHSSKGLQANLTTQGLNDFKEDEDLTQIKIKNETSEESASIEFENIQCDKLQGPLTFLIKYRCMCEWCSNTMEQSNHPPSSQTTVNLTALQPYCQYKCDLFYCRNSTNCKILNSGSFWTKASVPNKLRDFSVVAAGKDLISMRWLPPYPPTGTLIGHKIITKCTSCRSEDKTITYFTPEKCSIWPEYYCFQITDHLYYNKTHSIEIEARNEENPKFIRVASETNILLQEKQPEKPYNISYIWNSNNNVELSWNHPNRTNGILEYFIIEVISRQVPWKNFPYKVEKERLIYNYMIPESLPSATELHIRIKARNNKYDSEYAEINESSYPPEPDLRNLQISITNYTETTISLSLNVTQVIDNPYVGQYLFILIDDYWSDMKDPNLAPLERLTNSKFNVTSQLRIVTVFNLKKLPTNVIQFTIGDGNEVEENEILKVKILNISLEKARYYNITILMLNEYRRKYRHTSTKTRALTEGNPKMTPPPGRRAQDEDNSGGNAAYTLFLLLLLIPIIIGVMIKRKNIVFVRPKTSLVKKMDSTTRILPSAEEGDETIPLDVKEAVVRIRKPVMRVKPKLAMRNSTNPPNAPTDFYSKPVKIAEFEEYVKTSIETGELERQHALFPRGQTQPWHYGSTKINKPKNRYNNLVAYDHSRVKLEKIDGDENSDYINANYIHGYNIEKAYIATQGPKSSTLNDFWRMIWQENVRHIVMLANIYEGGKKKVEQYWPNINEELTFQDIVVQYQSMELFANFEYRIFHVTKRNETRKLEQLHFSTWPDHGVPLYPQGLVPFLRKLLKIPLSSTSPIVVHCSAGVGRTGTIVLADTSLRMAAKQGVVDMLNNLQKLREQRPNMVDNVEQYKLAHLVVLESMMGLRTGIPCNDDMEKAVQKLIGNGDYKLQMNYLVETEWQDQAMKSVADCNEEYPNYPEKNRFQEIIPENQGRIFITRYPEADESSSYINAVEVDGFRFPGRFLVTQQPMPNTVGDFWRFVTERKVNVIISLNEIDPREKTCCVFWPTADNPELEPVDFLLVKFGSVTKLEYYDIYSLHVWMKNKREKEQVDVEIVAFKRWPAKSTVPPSSEEFVSFYEEANAISRSNNVIVTCFDGATASGAYVALSFIIEQMKLEHECDVCLAVRNIRHNRRQFVNDENQFLFLYECAFKFINGFQSYANFQNQ